MRRVLSLLLFATVSCSRSAERAPLPPLGKMVDIGGLRLNLRCVGNGNPTVVFDSGLGLDSGAWRTVEPELNKKTRLCVYDRAGRGRSDAAPYPHGLPQMARELHALLTRAPEAGPYILVGHSMAGATVRWFHRQHPEDVAGMVLLDPATRALFEANMARVTEKERSEFWKNVRALEGLNRDSMLQGYAGLDGSGQALGSLPLVILTAERDSEQFAARLRAHGELGRLSSDSLHLIVRRSGHGIPFDRPDAVANAVNAVVEACRSSAKLTTSALAGAKSL